MVDTILKEAMGKVHIDTIRNEITKMYQTVKAYAPDKLEDLDIAFALFPISQMKHIKKLVRKWTSCSGKHTN